jgi:chromosome partitioning protein
MLRNRDGNHVHVIVIGNEKGGCGKTTTSMHLIAALLDLGFKVGTVDIDSRQRSLTRYLENRRTTLFKAGCKLPMPHHVVVNKSPFTNQEDAEDDERTRLAEAIQHLAVESDFILVDCPGSDQYLSRMVHAYADTVITPINDSFIDLDVLAQVNPETMEVHKPSIYSEMLWEQKLLKAKRDGASMDWIVMRNRLSNLDAKNKRRVMDVLDKLATRIGFRVAPGFSERVIFRELFLQGLTVIDIMRQEMGVEIRMSHIAAREEVRELLRVLRIERVNQALKAQLEEDMRRKPKAGAAQPSASASVASRVASSLPDDDEEDESRSASRSSSSSTHEPVGEMAAAPQF